jgi:oligopeptide/dipeptide ABC transporter ATP-binding protein
LILITHDLGVVAEVADRVVVMYAGREVESGDITPVYHRPAHPYTIGLMDSLPRPDVHTERLSPIRGAPPDLLAIPSGCPFHPRCPYVRDRCRTEVPDLLPVGEGRFSACHFWEEVQRERAGV